MARTKFSIFTAISLVFLFCAVTLGSNDHSSHENSAKTTVVRHGHLKTFGPGEPPHFHKLDLSQFERVKDISKNPADMPPPINRGTPATVNFTLHVKEVISELAPGITYNYWTFNGTVPGPFLRVREGDTVKLNIINDESSSHTHSTDLHAVTGPGGGAMFTQVKPGETKAFRFKALNPGLYVYHCASSNVPLHITNGLYGLILVEPTGGFQRVDREFYVMQGEFYTKGKIGVEGFQEFDAKKMLYGNPEYIVFNGRVKALANRILKAKVGERVRLYVGNAGVSYISSFHVIGEIFDTVYHEASSLMMNNVQTTAIPAGGAAIIEFVLDVPGQYVLVDHALSRIDKGAWGLMEVEGPENADIYSSDK
ncbi:MAG: nitrite reductase, copper-containing [Thermodesulfovibrionia bacterium]|nr:nitrite reductase, copper-containing [Thermodesulfovibrionia bacterium]